MEELQHRRDEAANREEGIMELRQKLAEVEMEVRKRKEQQADLEELYMAAERHVQELSNRCAELEAEARDSLSIPTVVDCILC
jgi:predicted RNase H-like nuclease (RuvC/YqgF family)